MPRLHLGERTSVGSEYILSNQDELSSYLLYGDDATHGPIKKPSMSFPAEDLISRFSNYLSIYISADGLSNVIIKTLDDIKSGKSTPGEMTIAAEHLQRQLLFGTPEGAALYKANGHSVKKTWAKILAMNEADQTTLLNRALTTQEKFFHTEAFGSSFEPKQLLDMYTGYQYALGETLKGLEQNITLLKMQEMLRNRGWLLTNAEHAALKASGSKLAGSFVTPGNVKPRIMKTQTKEAPVFGNSLNGWMISKQASNWFAKEAGLGMVRKGTGNKIFQWFKLSKILDPVGGAIFANFVSSNTFHAWGAGPVPVKAKYIKRFRDDYNRFKRGEPLKDPRVEQIIREGIGTGSRAVELGGKQSSLVESFDNFVIDMMDSFGDTGALIESIQGIGSTKEINRLIEILSLSGYEKKLNTFLNNFKVETGSDSVRINTKIKRRDDPSIKAGLLRGAEDVRSAVNAYVDPMIDVYSIYDELSKGGYTLQLMDELKMPRSRAFGVASDTYVDYIDMSSLFNTLRYGALGGAGYGLFGMPFVGYSANGFYLAKTMLSKNTVRSWVSAHMMRSQDEALEQTLQMEFTMDQYRDIVQKPTLHLLPFQTAGVGAKPAFGKKKIHEDRVGGRQSKSIWYV